MERRKKGCESTKADEQLGIRVTFNNPNDGGKLFSILYCALQKEVTANGDIIAYYEAESSNIKISFHDDYEKFCELASEGGYWCNNYKMYKDIFKSVKIEYDIKLIDFVDGFAETFESFETRYDVEESRTRFLSDNIDDDSGRYGTMFADHKEFNTREFRVNGFC